MFEVALFLAPWILLGIVVLFIAFSGGPGEARQAYLTRGRRAFRIAMPLVYIALGLAVPALVIAARGSSTGGTEELAAERASDEHQRGRELFRNACATCHSLKAVNARGVTGPDLDGIGEMTPERVLTAIRVGGTGQQRMPAGLLEGEDARRVAEYVSEVAGQ